jgi:hypothetical protein
MTFITYHAATPSTGSALWCLFGTSEGAGSHDRQDDGLEDCQKRMCDFIGQSKSNLGLRHAQTQLGWPFRCRWDRYK